MSLKLGFTAVLLGASLLQSARAAKYFVYTGTYTSSNSKGIYVFQFDPASGAMEPPTLAAETANPSFLTMHPNGRFLYAVNEEVNGTVTSYALNRKTGALTKLNSVPSLGSAPCHLMVDKTGKTLLVANYSTGSVAAFSIGADGRLSETPKLTKHNGSGPDATRQEGPHAHAVVISSDNRFAFVPDLGTDQVVQYRLDPSSASLTPNDPPFVKLAPGSGPRHFAFHPKGKFAYANNEMGSTATAFAYDGAHGVLKELQTLSTLPNGYPGKDNATAEAEVDAKGRFLYVSNRGHDSIAVFAIGADGKLTAVEHAPTLGKTPRNFKIDPSGAYLLAANQESNSVVQFRIDAKSGKLTPTGKTLEIPLPVCLLFVGVK